MVSMKRKIIVNTLVGLAFLAIVIWAILSLGVGNKQNKDTQATAQKMIGSVLSKKNKLLSD